MLSINKEGYVHTKSTWAGADRWCDRFAAAAIQLIQKGIKTNMRSIYNEIQNNRLDSSKKQEKGEFICFISLMGVITLLYITTSCIG